MRVLAPGYSHTSDPLLGLPLTYAKQCYLFGAVTTYYISESKYTIDLVNKQLGKAIESLFYLLIFLYCKCNITKYKKNVSRYQAELVKFVNLQMSLMWNILP
jgi:hypothetical protein